MIGYVRQEELDNAEYHENVRSTCDYCGDLHLGLYYLGWHNWICPNCLKLGAKEINLRTTIATLVVCGIVFLGATFLGMLMIGLICLLKHFA